MTDSQVAINEDRLLSTAIQLIEIPSPTRSAGAVSDCLATILQNADFDVLRPECGWPDSPAVVARFDTGQPGPTIQFNGHLDTVHLPFVPPRVENGTLFGSGSSDMKGGVAAMVEAALVAKESNLLRKGSILVTAHDLHEAPWGDGSQVDHLIAEGYLGDAVLIPEYCHDPLPLAGRGLTILEVTFRRSGEPLHETIGGAHQPSVIAAAAALATRMHKRGLDLRDHSHPVAGTANCFVGQIHGGEIYNQAPTECSLSGTRRWIPGDDVVAIEHEVRQMCNDVAEQHQVTCELGYHFVRDAFEINESETIVQAFQTAHQAVTGRRLPTGAKPFVDDVNTFVHRGGIPGVTHGPAAKGPHTLNEEVPISELVRVAQVYAQTAAEFCNK